MRKAVFTTEETVIIYINITDIKALIIAGLFYPRPRFGTKSTNECSVMAADPYLFTWTSA